MPEKGVTTVVPISIRDRQRERTRRTLIDQARKLFAKFGYGSVGLTQIVEATGVTKGALYHHFDGKAALFRAVLEDVHDEVGRQVAAAAEAHADAWGQLVAGSHEFLDATLAPEIQQIMLIDGPAVLGWSQWRALDESASGMHLAEVLEDLIKVGELADQPVAPLAHLLSGAMNEAALWLASDAAGDEDRADAHAALDRLLVALRVPR
jgi:AcrR family transcriptional regulator